MSEERPKKTEQDKQIISSKVQLKPVDSGQLDPAEDMPPPLQLVGTSPLVDPDLHRQSLKAMTT